MSRRHDKLGIKQTIQKHWMDRVVNLMLAGLNEKEIRAELDTFLATQKPSGGTGERGPKTYGLAISMLGAWFAPVKDLIPFRDHALQLISTQDQRDWLPYHWAIISASYPFWFQVGKQTGRLFNLQAQITQAQIFSRLKEQYGDRETVARNARYAIRSFIAWGVLDDAQVKGCYQQGKSLAIRTPTLATLLYEAALHAVAGGTVALGSLQNNPGFFPFQLPVLSADLACRHNNRIDVIRCSLDDELLKLKSV